MAQWSFWNDNDEKVFIAQLRTYPEAKALAKRLAKELETGIAFNKDGSGEEPFYVRNVS